MPKKIKLNLTVSNNQLWWSADGGTNWAVAGPKSPVTVLQKDCEINWICDDLTITQIDVTLDSGDVLLPATGSKKDKTSLVNQNCSNGSLTKYTLVINGGAYRIDPEAKYCNPPCPPGGNG